MPSAVRRPTLAIVLQDAPPSLRALLLADFTFDDDATAALWGRYLADRSSADEQRLIEHYLPSLGAAVSREVGARCLLFPDPLEDYISDAMLGLLRFVRQTRGFKPRITAWLARKAMVRAVWTESRMRSWAGKSRTERARTIELIRAELIRENGSVPSDTQIIQRLGQRVTNPNIYVSAVNDPVRTMHAQSQLEPDEFRPCVDVAPEAQPLMSEEVIQLALRGFKGNDRKIFRLMIAGESASAIARKMGVSNTRIIRRLNGMLWEARCRADLAEWFGVEPAKEKSRRSDGTLLAISQVPPARLVG